MMWKAFCWTVDVLAWVFMPFARFVDWTLERYGSA